MTKKSQTNSQPIVIGMIPARLASTRFPGKILHPIAGKSLIQHTFENAQRCNLLKSLIIATEDKRVFDHVTSFGARAIMTSVDCLTGTDRIVEALRNNNEWNDADIIVNIQGDEPCLDPEVIQKVVEALVNDPEAVMSTAATKLECAEEALSSSIVKCAIDQNGNALYFSRALIGAGKSGKWHPKMPIFRHMGLYAFRRDFLLKYGDLPVTPLQLAEDLEQLKVLEHGFRIKVALVDHFSIGVDIPDDIQKVELWLCKQNTSSSPVASALL
ncbi:MAG: 3-deoxy-manno-octulosonate cytidylyltransferase [Parachlamydiaceae bacterium]|nr:3-deoxy-manno-octulosonate cytidylyltransferase [Parachlamydiaceae bacterium]